MGTAQGTGARRTTAGKTGGRKGTRTKLDESKLKKFLDGRLIYAISHVVRAHVLAVLNEKIASPNELAKEIGVDVNYINYHFEKLEEIEFIELVRTEPRRGFEEHFYRAKETFFFDCREWEELPLSLKVGMSTDHLQALMEDVQKALKAGTFESRGDRHLSWTPMLVDEEGWRDTTAILNEAAEQLMAIQAESTNRLSAKTGVGSVSATVGIMSFETPHDSERPDTDAAATG